MLTTTYASARGSHAWTKLTGWREAGLAKVLEADLGTFASFDGDGTRRGYERRRVRVEPHPFPDAPARRDRAVPDRDDGPREGGKGRVRGRGTVEVVLDMERVHVRRELLPRVFVDEGGGGVDRAVFAVEEGGGDVDGVRERKRRFDQRKHGLFGDR